MVKSIQHSLQSINQSIIMMMKFSLSIIALTGHFVALLVQADDNGYINIPPCSANAKFCESGSAYCQYPGSKASQ
jgi:hypothetical protein